MSIKSISPTTITRPSPVPHGPVLVINRLRQLLFKGVLADFGLVDLYAEAGGGAGIAKLLRIAPTGSGWYNE